MSDEQKQMSEERAQTSSQRARDAASFMIENLEVLSELVTWWVDRQKRIHPFKPMEKRDRPSRGYRIETELVERVRELSRDQTMTFEDALNWVIQQGLEQVKG